MTVTDVSVHTTDRLARLRSGLETRSLVMGVLNITPDSFSDGGRYLDPDEAVSRGLTMIAEGADVLDLGAESSRPGAEPVSAEEQCRRLLPVVETLRQHNRQIALSIDTTSAVVAEAALEAGADIINDITALQGDPEMARVACDHHAGVVLMHMRGTPQTMQQDTHYTDVVAEVAAFLAARIRVAVSAGIPSERLWLDPGIGFGKSVSGNLCLLRNLEAFDQQGCPLVIGVSRKSVIGKILKRDVADRLAGTLAVTAFTASHGNHRIHRVHDVAAVRDTLKIVEVLSNPMIGEESEPWT